MWKRLAHPNILPLLGITGDPFQLISDWVSGWDLPDYIKNTNANRLGLVGVSCPAYSMLIPSISYLVSPMASASSTPAM